MAQRFKINPDQIKIFDTIGEAEGEMRKSIPSPLYKYRSWQDKNHQKCLTRSEIWFGSPKTMNDVYDIRVPYQLDYNELNDPRALERFKAVVSRTSPFAAGSREFDVWAENLFDQILLNPTSWFEQNAEALRNGSFYDEVGLFSTSCNPLEQLMWGYYADSHRGFVVGFDPVSVMKSHPCNFGKVQYSDEPFHFSLVEGRQADEMMEFFLKSLRWKHEEEYRFYTFVESESDRLVSLIPGTISEVLLGSMMLQKDKKEIIQILIERFNRTVSLYQVNESPSTNNLKVTKLDY